MIRRDQPGPEAIELDVLIVGAGPAGLACAIELHRQSPDLTIGVLEKAGSLGEHTLSGAVINPVAIRALFPELKDEDFPFRQRVDHEAVYYLTRNGSTKVPTPPTMQNRGYYSASLCEVVRWMGEQAETRGINLFPGFPAESLFVDGERVIGVRTVPSGLDRAGEPTDVFQEPTDLMAKVVVLAEGSRGALAQAWRSWRGVGSANPQIFALGVKEVWQVKQPLDRIIHTLGWPLPAAAFGGSWCYPMGPDQVSIGLVVGLDYHDATLDVHESLQRMKRDCSSLKYTASGTECMKMSIRLRSRCSLVSTCSRCAASVRNRSLVAASSSVAARAFCSNPSIRAASCRTRRR